MTKIEYQNSIKTHLTKAEALCADLRKLRNVKKLTADLPAIEGLLNTSVLDKAIADRETDLKKIRAELGKARRIVKHLEEIEAIENGTEPIKAPAKKAPASKAAEKSTSATKALKTPKVSKAAAAPAA
ncbi:hypothetical protein [Agathobaculum desmolans]|uniref:hypothetical protein n=1 Tax=Agathobaculum desmolans TaxID=39484 RepID=UPI0004E106CF|nr:hypothetical protein [Agathobaculum desmolans]